MRKEQQLGKGYDHALSKQEFQAVYNCVSETAIQNRSRGDFKGYLEACQHQFMLGFMAFTCPRGGEELAFIEFREFEILGRDKLSYTPLQTVKNTGVDKSKNIVNKDSSIIIGAWFVEFFTIMKSKRQLGWRGCERVFHRVHRSVSPDSPVYFEKMVHGEGFCGSPVSKYVAILRAAKKFNLAGQFNNMSVRKTHTQVLNKSLLPASVQQKSLGHRKGNQNWNKYYNDSQDPEILDSVAATISQALFPTTAQTPQ